MAKAGKKKSPDSDIFATNRKARRDYEILSTLEVGVELKGTEIKSIRQRRVSLDGSFARIDGGEVFLYNMHINPYEQGNRFNVEPLRERKLLLHRLEIRRLDAQMKQKRLTLIPLKLYQKHGLAKIELGLGKGKKVFEKRDRIRERETERDLKRRVQTFQKRGR